MRAVYVLSAVLLLSACDRGASPDPANPAGNNPIAGGDLLARGETLSFACQACHSLANDGRHLIGPNLYGMFGRTAGSVPDYAGYSDALIRADFVWSESLLAQWLENPASFLQGTTMAFTGYRSAADREALIRYLATATGGTGAASVE